MYVLAANAMQNATLLLASGAANSSGLVGRNLMDHPLILTWGLTPEPVWGYRGPLSTSGLEMFRDGEFRERSSAFRIEIGNEGWNFSEGAPISTVKTMVTKRGLYGRELRQQIGEVIPRQFRLALEMEQIPEASNHVTIDRAYRDQLGNYRPVIHYDLPEYVRSGFAMAKQASNEMFKLLGVEPLSKGETGTTSRTRGTTRPTTKTTPATSPTAAHGYTFQGAGHLAGTHRMGSAARYFGGGQPAAQLGPREPLSGRLRQHADHRHLEPDADNDGAGHLGRPATSATTWTRCHDHRTPPDQKLRRPARSPSVRDRPRAGHHTCLSLRPLQHQTRSEQRGVRNHPERRARGDAAHGLGRERAQRDRRRAEHRPGFPRPEPGARLSGEVPFIDRIPVIHLQAFSPAALDEFIAIESPGELDSSDRGKHAAGQDSSDRGEQYGSIGDFYRAIEDGVQRLCPERVFRDARKKRRDCQLRSADYYGGAGMLFEVTGKKAALTALKAIAREGEGLARKALRQTAGEHARSGMRPGLLTGHGSLPVVDADKLPYGWKMYSHYARFKEIRYGRRYCTEAVGRRETGR